MWWILYIILGLLAIIVLYAVVWVIRGSRSQEFLEKEQEINRKKLELYDERLRRNDNIIAQSNERVKYSEEFAKKAKDYSAKLDILERQIRNNLFTEAEMLEITKEKDHATEVALRSVEATNVLIKLTKKSTQLILSWKDKNEEILALEKEIEEVDKEVRAYDKEVLACFPAIERWIDLGRQREANSGLTS